MRTPLFLILLMSSSAAFAAVQSPAASHAADDWKALSCMMDKDKNGKLTQKETLSFNPMSARLLVQNFAEIDANKDGQVTLKEYTSYVDKGRAAWEAQFKKADTDNSGGLSRAELKATKPGEFGLLKRFFDKFDANRDGQVTIAEHDSYTQQLQELRASRRASGGERNMGRRPGNAAAPR